MKVERNEIKFEPVKIVIESEAELEFLWHYFNKSTSRTYSDYLSDTHFDGSIGAKHETLKHQIWRELDNHFDGRREMK